MGLQNFIMWLIPLFVLAASAVDFITLKKVINGGQVPSALTTKGGIFSKLIVPLFIGGYLIYIAVVSSELSTALRIIQVICGAVTAVDGIVNVIVGLKYGRK